MNSPVDNTMNRQRLRKTNCFIVLLPSMNSEGLFCMLSIEDIKQNSIGVSGNNFDTIY